MKYFLKNDEVFAFDDEQEALLDLSSFQPISEEEANKIIENQNKPTDFDLWLKKMAELDHYVPRPVENIIDVLGTEKLNSFMVEKYNEKKELRKNKPIQ